jgi:hypothetical protein
VAIALSAASVCGDSIAVDRKSIAAGVQRTERQFQLSDLASFQPGKSFERSTKVEKVFTQVCVAIQETFLSYTASAASDLSTPIFKENQNRAVFKG